MSTFIQFHILTTYPPSNVNRDDLGRPKTAVFGGVTRSRISSQSLKRSWRMSSCFAEEMSEYCGQRTKFIGSIAYDTLIKLGFSEEVAALYAKNIASNFGKVKGTEGKETEIEQLCFISPKEIKKVTDLCEKMNEKFSDAEKTEVKQKKSGKKNINEALVDISKHEDTKDLVKNLLSTNAEGAVDIAMFGRMLADKPQANVEAAVQVAHALSIHQVTVEDDYFTALDDLQSDSEAGSSHIGNREFTESTMYKYICVNADLLLQNLANNKSLTTQSIKSLIRAMVTSTPSGMKNSFGSSVHASYVMMEIGTTQPRNLAVSFLKPIRSNYLENGVKALKTQRNIFENVYGNAPQTVLEFDAVNNNGTLNSLLAAIDGIYGGENQ